MTRLTDDEDDKLSEDEVRSISASQSDQLDDPRYKAALAFIEACGWPADGVSSIVIGPGGAVASIYKRDNEGKLILNPANPAGQPLREHVSVLWGFRIPRAEPSQTVEQFADQTFERLDIAPKCLDFWQKMGVRGIRACNRAINHEGQHEDSLGFRWDG